jgi:hypothetical protein
MEPIKCPRPGHDKRARGRCVFCRSYVEALIASNREPIRAAEGQGDRP